MTEMDASSSKPQTAQARPTRTKRLLMRQPIMNRVIYALVPVLLAGVYFFGWRVVAVLAGCNAAGLVTEFITSRKRGTSVSMAYFVTCWLFALSLPPTAGNHSQTGQSHKRQAARFRNDRARRMRDRPGVVALDET